MKKFRKYLTAAVAACLVFSGCNHGSDALTESFSENMTVAETEENALTAYETRSEAITVGTEASSAAFSETVSEISSKTASENTAEAAETTVITAAAPPKTTEKPSEAEETETKNAMQSEKPPAADSIQDIIDNMSLEEKVGQIILVRYSAETAAKASQYHFGGYTLYAVDFAEETPESIQAKLEKIRSNSSLPPFFAADEEGGQVVRISKYAAFSSSPLPAIGSDSAKSDIRGFAAKTAEVLKKGGINLNLAPVADVAESESDYIYGRTCKEDYEKTGEIIGELVRELNGSGIISCLKHFPGYGSNVDTHTGIAVDNRSKESFESKDFIPFKAGIKADVPMIMVNHNIITAYNDKVPASLAPEVHKALRELGFNGVIVTDDLGMGAITQYSGNPYADAVLAGNDLLCTSDGESCYKAVYDAVKNGAISEKWLDESIYRILTIKKRYGVLQ